jgi:DNA-binding transcriptional LysR family regulator
VLHTDRLVLVVGRRHPWFVRETLDWPELDQTSWIMREPGSGTRALFETALVENGMAPEGLKTALVFRSGEAIVNAVASGTAATVVSELVAATAIKAGLLRRLAPISIARSFNALRLPGRPVTRAGAALRQHLHTSMRSIG